MVNASNRQDQPGRLVLDIRNLPLSASPLDISNFGKVVVSVAIGDNTDGVIHIQILVQLIACHLPASGISENVAVIVSLRDLFHPYAGGFRLYGLGIAHDTIELIHQEAV
ncbi:MAG: hypothetical protein ACLR4A_02875 [Christensenellales bacterium]